MHNLNYILTITLIQKERSGIPASPFLKHFDALVLNYYWDEPVNIE